MHISRREWTMIWAALVVVVLIAGAVWHYRRGAAPVPGVPAPAATTTPSDAAASTAAPAAEAAFPINPADAIASWSFKGSYSGNATLVAQAQADIAHLSGLVGKGQYDDYDLYNGIANDETELGDGRAAYQYYNRAIGIYPKEGLAYTNLGHLMDQLGAYYTAADAYAKAVAVEPSVLTYHLNRLNFLTTRLPHDSALIAAAFGDASKQFGDSASVLSIEAEWLTGLGRYADAIKAWQTVKMLSSADRAPAIDAEIARLEAKLAQ